MQNQTFSGSAWLAFATITLALSACGGGGDAGTTVASSAPAPPHPQGVYAGTLFGTLFGSSSSEFELLVLENDELWSLYGASTPSVFLVAGFAQGQGASTSTTFTSSNVRGFGTVPATAGTLSATYVANTSISGTISATAGSVAFAGTPIIGSTYDYNVAANLASITVAWTMTALDASVINLTIAGNGAIVGSTGGCSFTGTLTPRASGKNVFNTSVTFGAVRCRACLPVKLLLALV